MSILVWGALVGRFHFQYYIDSPSRGGDKTRALDEAIVYPEHDSGALLVIVLRHRSGSMQRNQV